MIEPIEIGGLRYYPMEDRRLVSVTAALGWVFRYGAWVGYRPGDPAILTARRRGRAVHRACEILAKGATLDESTVHLKIRPYLDQFINFVERTGWRATAVEQTVRSLRYGYAGRLDQVGEWPPYKRESGGLLDLKTTQDTWLAEYQVAAYDTAYRETTGDDRPRLRGTLILDGGKPDGWRLRELREPTGFSGFLSALNCLKLAEHHRKLERRCPECGATS